MGTRNKHMFLLVRWASRCLLLARVQTHVLFVRAYILSRCLAFTNKSSTTVLLPHLFMLLDTCSVFTYLSYHAVRICAVLLSARPQVHIPWRRSFLMPCVWHSTKDA